MALDAGNEACTTGLSKRIFDEWEANDTLNPSGDPLAGDGAAIAKAMAYVFAKSVVAEIVANGKARISSSTGSLQRYISTTGDTVDTTAPTADHTLPLE